MARNLVLKDGVLSAVVESWEPVEMAQLEAEVTSRQAAYDSLQAQVEQLAEQVESAKVALEEAKSEHEMAQGLVVEPADVGTETNDDGSVPVGVTVAGAEPQY